jgi:hypothetical protein
LPALNTAAAAVCARKQLSSFIRCAGLDAQATADIEAAPRLRSG